MQRLIAFALTQRLLVALLAVGLAFAGYEAFRQLPIDAFPDISPTQACCPRTRRRSKRLSTRPWPRLRVARPETVSSS